LSPPKLVFARMPEVGSFMYLPAKNKTEGHESVM